MGKFRTVIGVLAAALLLSAAAVFERDRVTVVTVDGKRHAFDVEMARRPDQLSQGLMNRRSMPANSGMLFDFTRPRPVSMWMKDTLIPLDMVFVGSNGRIVHIAERTVPLSETEIAADQPVRAVLELNAGTASRLGIKVGDRLDHPIFGSGR